VPRHIARLVAPLIVDYSGLVVDYFTSAARPGASAHARLVTRLVAPLVVDYFAYAARLGASAHRAAHRLLSTTSPTQRGQVPWHVAWIAAWPVTGFVVDYSVRRNFLLRPH
jgi:hypothetical protein